MSVPIVWSVTFEREGDDLVIDNDPNGATFWLAEQDATWPSFSMRRRTVQSDNIDGETILGATRAAGQITLGIYVRAASIADMLDAVAELEAATSQLSYMFTNTVGGVATSYEAFAELPQWGNNDSGMTAAYMAKATIVIPLNPPAGA